MARGLVSTQGLSRLEKSRALAMLPIYRGARTVRRPSQTSRKLLHQTCMRLNIIQTVRQKVAAHAAELACAASTCCADQEAALACAGYLAAAAVPPPMVLPWPMACCCSQHLCDTTVTFIDLHQGKCHYLTGLFGTRVDVSRLCWWTIGHGGGHQPHYS